MSYSGGADSSVLLAALVRVGQGDQLTAATFESPLHHPDELDRARALTRELGVEHLVIPEDPLAQEEFSANPRDRCYVCKKSRLEFLTALARDREALILDGTNFSDTGVHRPGLRALEEAGACSPLALAGLTRDQVLNLGRWLGVEDWLRPASACLATRVPYGEPLTPELLTALGRAEERVAALTGAEPGSFRIRVHGQMARLETSPGLWPRLTDPELAARLAAQLKAFGFTRVTLDLEGYASGSMDRLERLP